MSNTETLKKYLLTKENPYLLDDNNNGKTIMLSGKWGSGKTHFWQNEIEPKLKKEQIAIYISLYGKESINEIKFDIFKEAYNSQIKEDIISKSASLFHSVAPSFGEKSLTEGFAKLNQESKTKKATEILKQGSIICFDDFERKSEKINLNDLFGFISQLSIDLNCKTVIILNSEVFRGKEAEIFSNVKEKTISKFFYFNPTIDELFKSISNNPKYDVLNENKKDILSVIKETKELNARIYTQVLDNCLEWIVVKKSLNNNNIRVLILGTFNFILNHIIFKYIIPIDTRNETVEYNYEEIIFANKKLNQYFYFVTKDALDKNFTHYAHPTIYMDEEKFIKFLIEHEVSPDYIEKNKVRIKALWKYGYYLYYVSYVDETTYNEITNFIKTGILLP